MQTFLPYSSFYDTARTLDDKRLGKQRVEALQILNVIGRGEAVGGWINHPAVNMWRGYEDALKIYTNCMIENRLHWRRDVTLGEDACQVRKGDAPRVLSILNSLLLALFDWLGVMNVASYMRRVCASPLLALLLFVLSIERIK